MFRPGLMTSSLASRDSFMLSTTNGEVSFPTAQSFFRSKSNIDRNPKPIPPFTPRPPMQHVEISPSMRKHLKRKHLFFTYPNHKPHPHKFPKNLSNPRCARFRLWLKEAPLRRRQLKLCHDLTERAKQMFVDPVQRSLALFSMFTRLRDISFKSDLTPQKPSKRPRLDNPSDIFRPPWFTW